MEFLDSLSITQLKVLYVGIALVGAGTFVFTARMARGACGQHARSLMEFLASIPSQFRALRDPVFRKRRVAAAAYETALRDALLARGVCEGIRNAPAPVSGLENARERRLANAWEDVHKLHESTAKALLALDDGDVRYVAERMHERWLGGASTVEEVEAFLREERERFRFSPHLVAAHMRRFSQRFGEACRQKRSDGADAAAE